MILTEHLVPALVGGGVDHTILLAVLQTLFHPIPGLPAHQVLWSIIF